MKKKYLSMIMAAALALSITACSGGGNGSGVNSENTGSEASSGEAIQFWGVAQYMFDSGNISSIPDYASYTDTSLLSEVDSSLVTTSK